MSSNKQKSEGSSSQTSVQQAGYAPGEQDFMNQMQQLSEAWQPGMMSMAQNAPNLINLLLTGQQLPGGYGDLYGGISESVIGDISRKSIEDMRPYLQQAGILDSGTEAELYAQSSRDIRNKSAQFNIQNRMNLLNMPLTGLGQVGQQGLTQQQMYGNQLQGLRPMTQTMRGTSSSTQSGGMNPFLQAALSYGGQALGTAIGGPIGGAVVGSLFSASTDAPGYTTTYANGNTKTNYGGTAIGRTTSIPKSQW